MDGSRIEAISAELRAFPPLAEEVVGHLLAGARAVPAGEDRQRLVEHHLRVALEAATARPESVVGVGDLYQEGAVAVVVAVTEYTNRSGDAAGLRAYVERVVSAHLDAVEEQEVERRRSDEIFVNDARSLEEATLQLRRRLGRPATTVELAAALRWEPSRVEVVGEMLDGARLIHDEELAPYLDDE